MKNDKFRSITEGFNELKKQGLKQINEVKNFAIKAYDTIKDTLAFRNVFNEETIEYLIVGSQNIINQPIKIRAFRIDKNELLFKYDDKEINRIYPGTIIKSNKDNNSLQIKHLDNTKQVYHLLEVEGEEYHIPCFKAKYKNIIE